MTLTVGLHIKQNDTFHPEKVRAVISTDNVMTIISAMPCQIQVTDFSVVKEQSEAHNYATPSLFQ